jgi:hypothetical protein
VEEDRRGWAMDIELRERVIHIIPVIFSTNHRLGGKLPVYFNKLSLSLYMFLGNFVCELFFSVSPLLFYTVS